MQMPPVFIITADKIASFKHNSSKAMQAVKCDAQLQKLYLMLKCEILIE